MVSLLDLPNELICTLFNYTETPLDYYRLCLIHPLLYDIGRSFNTRYAFLYRTLIDDEQCHVNNDRKQYNQVYFNNNKINQQQRQYNKTDNAKLRHQQDLTRSTLCRFLASSPIPLSSIYALSLLELIPTTHYCQFTDHTDTNTKKALLQVFSKTRSSRHHHRTITSSLNKALTIPTLVNKTLVATAKTCNRHRDINGTPRRVYYHVTLQNAIPTPLVDNADDIIPLYVTNPFINSALTETTLPSTSSTSSPSYSTTTATPSIGDTLFIMIHDTDTVVGFDQDLNCHYGRLWYEDEGIVTDSSWSNLLELDQTHHSTEQRRSDDCTWRPDNVSMGYSTDNYYYKTYYPHHCDWRPYLLQTIYNCTLKQNVRKGGLKKGDRFDCVFVYEHREDDTIGLEFCQWDEQRLRYMPQGFLLFAEHHIVWTS